MFTLTPFRRDTEVSLQAKHGKMAYEQGLVMTVTFGRFPPALVASGTFQGTFDLDYQVTFIIDLNTYHLDVANTD
jgi:hypothetical protein